MTMVNWCCCQICGRVISTAEAEADGWLVGEDKRRPGRRVIRCYEHWSEWAMRNSVGRTKGNRLKMKEGRERESEPVFLNAPFPLEDRP